MNPPLFIEKVAAALGKGQASKLTCLQPAPVLDGSFYLFEGTDKRSYAVPKEDEVQASRDYLLVHTSSDALIGFIAVDECLISKNRKKCDAALSWETEVILLDLKLSTQNIAPGIFTAQSFHEQMKSTIGYFQNDLNIAMSDFSVRLCIVFPVATITTTMSAELFGLESDIHNLYGLDVRYVLIPDTPSMGISPVLNL